MSMDANVAVPLPSRVHKRGYQACSPCRKKKVKCDLGSIEAPRQPPCARCLREGKHCHFSAVRTQPSRGRAGASDVKHPSSIPETAATTRDNPLLPSLVVRPTSSGEADFRNAPRSLTDNLRMLSKAFSEATESSIDPQSPYPEDALRSWSKLRFVHEGLFTASEALDYVEYFFSNLAPFTLVLGDTYHTPAIRQASLLEEPVLTLTIIALASRFCRPSGYGAQSRRFIIHDRLWRRLYKVVTHIAWGEDSFSLQPTRTLGTSQALLLLAEWHPLTLHFPEDDYEIVMSVRDPKLNEYTAANAMEWLDWPKRSDRIRAFVVGTALTIATELGLVCQSGIGSEVTEASNVNSQAAQDLGRLLTIFARNCRLPLSPSPKLLREPTTSALELWLQLSDLANDMENTLYPSREQNERLFVSGQYLDILYSELPRWRAWKALLDSATYALQQMRLVMTAEYGYFCLRACSMALRTSPTVSTTVKAQQELDRGDNLRTLIVGEIERSGRATISAVMHAFELTGRHKCVTIRVYERLYFAVLFLFKTNNYRFSRRIEMHEASRNLDLIEKVARAVCNSGQDDANSSPRWSFLLETLVNAQREYFFGNHQATADSSAARQSAPHATVEPDDWTRTMNQEPLSGVEHMDSLMDWSSLMKDFGLS